MNLNSQSTLNVHRGKFTSRNKHVPVAVRINIYFSTDVINLQNHLISREVKQLAAWRKKKKIHDAPHCQSLSEFPPFCSNTRMIRNVNGDLRRGNFRLSYCNYNTYGDDR